MGARQTRTAQAYARPLRLEKARAAKLWCRVWERYGGGDVLTSSLPTKVVVAFSDDWTALHFRLSVLES